MNKPTQSFKKHNPIAIALGISKEQLKTTEAESAFYFNESIITDLSDNDLYKFNMMNGVYTYFRDKEVEVKFKCRSDKDLSSIVSVVRDQIQRLSNLGFSEMQIAVLKKKAPYCTKDFFDFLKWFKLDSRKVTVEKCGKNNLEIIAKGTWLEVILFEILVLAIVSEVDAVMTYPNATMTQFRSKLFKKIKYLKELKAKGEIGDDFKFADFGTRRRFSKKVHDCLVETLTKELPNHFIGTSNIRLAAQHDILAIGTQAHEWFQAHQQIYRLQDSQAMALENWVKLYRGENGVALTDCISMTTFMEGFDKYFARLFEGLRHDSGCPFKWGELAIEAFEKNGVDPKTKTLVFSDGLNFEKAVEIYKHFRGRIKVSFGIGTFLTNDMDIPEHAALNIVMKIITLDGQPVVKLSDSPGKNMCEDENFVAVVKKTFNYDNRIMI